MPLTLPSKTAPKNGEADAVNALADIRTEGGCSDCGQRGPTWENPDTCDHFCLACLSRYIAWEEGELKKARAAFALLTVCRRRYAA